MKEANVDLAFDKHIYNPFLMSIHYFTRKYILLFNKYLDSNSIKTNTKYE